MPYKAGRNVNNDLSHSANSFVKIEKMLQANQDLKPDSAPSNVRCKSREVSSHRVGILSI